MNPFNKFICTTIVVLIIIINTANSTEQLTRNKRGLSDFFKRFWNIRKKNNNNNYTPFQPSAAASSIYPQFLGQDYLMPQSSNYYPLYQPGNPSPPQQQQFYGESSSPSLMANQANQIDYQTDSMRPSNYYPSSVDPAGQYQQPQQPSDQQQQYYYQQQQSSQQEYQNSDQPNVNDNNNNNNNNNYYYNNNYANSLQADESIRKSSYYYPHKYVHKGPIGTSPYTFHSNPSQANTFKSKPYGSYPGTLDVHQVLDQFIRSAGLSPQGDHENANKNYAYDEDKALSVKKLYSYPFYFSSSGEKQYTIRRQSIDENIDDEQQQQPSVKQSQQQPSLPTSTKATVQRVKQPNQPVKPAKIEPINHNNKPQNKHQSNKINDSVATDNNNNNNIMLDDESSFIAKNAAALQDFLTKKTN